MKDPIEDDVHQLPLCHQGETSSQQCLCVGHKICDQLYHPLAVNTEYFSSFCGGFCAAIGGLFRDPLERKVPHPGWA